MFLNIKILNFHLICPKHPIFSHESSLFESPFTRRDAPEVPLACVLCTPHRAGLQQPDAPEVPLSCLRPGKERSDDDWSLQHTLLWLGESHLIVSKLFCLKFAFFIIRPIKVFKGF